jgi:hypothetical protein
MEGIAFDCFLGSFAKLMKMLRRIQSSIHDPEVVQRRFSMFIPCEGHRTREHTLCHDASRSLRIFDQSITTRKALSRVELSEGNFGEFTT